MLTQILVALGFALLYCGPMFLLALGATWGDRVLGSGRPGNVISVDEDRDTVTVRYFDRGAFHAPLMAVDDASAYALGDEVEVFVNAETRTPETLDREPLAPELIEIVGVFLLAVAAFVAGGSVLAAYRARGRRRGLASPWTRTTAETWPDAENTCNAFLPFVGGGSFWRVGGELPLGPITVDIAGDPDRWIVVRVAGTTELVSARRRCRRATWSHRCVLAWNHRGPTLACAVATGSSQTVYEFGSEVNARVQELVDEVELLHGPGRVAVRADAWPGVVLAKKVVGHREWPELSTLAKTGPRTAEYAP